jgi:hypothetical protein
MMMNTMMKMNMIMMMKINLFVNFISIIFEF